jgi:glycosyltransferase involved in cell wall biosynthesis
MKQEDEGTISVVVPIYNQQKYLNISIPSILNQSYDKIEVLLVNDGSTDQSLEIIKKYANLDKE